MKKIKEFCKRHGITEDQFYGKEKIEGYLYLNSLTSIPEGFNPTVGGYLDLSRLTSIPEGFNPTVGGYLYLNSLTSIPEGFNPTVGGYLDLRSETIEIGAEVPEINISWANGKYRLIDGVFCESTGDQSHVVDGFEIQRLKKINKNEFFFLAKKDKWYSHGESIAKAIADLRFKIMAEKVKKEPITKDTVITRQHYRIITGACEFGVSEWMRVNNITKEEITAEELLPLLEHTNAYGLSQFKKLVSF